MSKRTKKMTKKTIKTKPIIANVMKVAFNNEGGGSVDYDDFVGAKTLTPVFGGLGEKISMEKTVLLLESWGFDIPSEAQEDFDELKEYLSQIKDERINRDNTYNWSWWGPTIDFMLIESERDPYLPYILIAKMHLGGDVRGNYGPLQAWKFDKGFASVFHSWTLNVHLVTTRGKKITLDSEDTEAYNFIVVDDKTGLLPKEGDTIKIDELESLFEWKKTIW